MWPEPACPAAPFFAKWTGGAALGHVVLRPRSQTRRAEGSLRNDLLLDLVRPMPVDFTSGFPGCESLQCSLHGETPVARPWKAEHGFGRGSGTPVTDAPRTGRDQRTLISAMLTELGAATVTRRANLYMGLKQKYSVDQQQSVPRSRPAIATAARRSRGSGVWLLLCSPRISIH